MTSLTLSSWRYHLQKVLKIRLFSSVPKLPECDFQPEKYKGLHYDDVVQLRRLNLNPVIPCYYEKPFLITQGHKQWVFDETGKRYLDMFAGIVTVSVGHCHPKLIEAAHKQMKTLWHVSNIYLEPSIYEYANKVTKTLPPELNVCYFTTSGSEANDLALMMARIHTGQFDVISLRNAYHGGSPYVMGATASSKWKLKLANNIGVHHAMNPDVYRGLWGGKFCRDSPTQTYRHCDCKNNTCSATGKYLEQMEEILLYSVPNKEFAAFIAESIQGVGGIVQYPNNFLKMSYELARKHGAICIADEVQTGLGRTGDNFWGFESHGVIPDIVTVAKGIAGGFPMAAVFTTAEIAKSLSTSLHMSTFGGNPIGCSIASTVLDIINEEELQNNCKKVGTHLIQELTKLRDEFQVVGDVRGKGLMIGVELVADKNSRTPIASNLFSAVWEDCRKMGLLLGRGGYHGNVFRIQPPMCIDKDDANFCVSVLRQALKNNCN